MAYGSCSKCGWGQFNYEPVEVAPVFVPLIGVATTNYCSKCGASLTQTCFACHGTGKTMDLVQLDFGPRYCSECGRALKKKKKSNTCTSCGGKGKTSSIHHVCS
jgi:hypothetical protein